MQTERETVEREIRMIHKHALKEESEFGEKYRLREEQTSHESEAVGATRKGPE